MQNRENTECQPQLQNTAAAVAAMYVEAEEVKVGVAASLAGAGTALFHSPPSPAGGDWWLRRHNLLKRYKTLLVEHLAFALEKKVELDLWNSCFKDPISKLNQQLAKLKKDGGEGNPAPPATAAAAAKAFLDWLLDSANGFYTVLLGEVQSAAEGELTTTGDRRKQLEYVTQHALVHLGDVARYRGRTPLAYNYYRQAVSAAPSHGHAYNQIALLESSSKSGGDLSAVYFYVRSLSVQHPFSMASANLAKMFERRRRRRRVQTEHGSRLKSRVGQGQKPEPKEKKNNEELEEEEEKK